MPRSTRAHHTSTSSVQGHVSAPILVLVKRVCTDTARIAYAQLVLCTIINFTKAAACGAACRAAVKPGRTYPRGWRGRGARRAWLRPGRPAATLPTGHARWQCWLQLARPVRIALRLARPRSPAGALGALCWQAALPKLLQPLTPLQTVRSPGRGAACSTSRRSLVPLLTGVLFVAGHHSPLVVALGPRQVSAGLQQGEGGSQQQGGAPGVGLGSQQQGGAPGTGWRRLRWRASAARRPAAWRRRACGWACRLRRPGSSRLRARRRCGRRGRHTR
jgi:hypothetical protein